MRANTNLVWLFQLLSLWTTFSSSSFIVVVTAQPPPLPYALFHLWEQLYPNEQQAASNLGYTIPSWEFEIGATTNPMTSMAYSTILQDNFTTLLDFVNVGLSEWQWDCYVNGYDDYFWFELVSEEIAPDMMALGWTPAKWNGSDPVPPLSESKFYDELSPAEQVAANNICYFRERWNELPLSEWAPLVRTTPQSCLAGTNTVLEQTRGTLLVQDLQVGDVVQSSTTDPPEFSRVFSLYHVDVDSRVPYVSIRTETLEEPLELTHNHILFVNDHRPVRARDVRLGDLLDGRYRVTHVSMVHRVGAYAPLTESGQLVVNGGMATTSSYVAKLPGYSAAFQHTVARAVTAPLRWACRLHFDICLQETHTAGVSNYFGRAVQLLDTIVTLPIIVQGVMAALAMPLVAIILAVDYIMASTTLVSVVIAVGVVLCMKRRLPPKQKCA